MPFPTQGYPFNEQTVKRVAAVGGVYGLAQPIQAGRFRILYVGNSDNLRRRLLEHLNNPPIRGIAHFFVEAVPTALARYAREATLIREFDPPGNTVGKP